MKVLRIIPVLLTMLILVFVITGCCSIGIGSCIKRDTVLIQSDNDLNACGDQEHSALNIRIYYLKNANKFNGINDILDFWEDDEGTLGTDMVGSREEFWIQAGESGVAKVLERPKDAVFIGVVGNYCNPDGIFYSAYQLKKGSAKLTLHLQRIDLTLAESP